MNSEVLINPDKFEFSWGYKYVIFSDGSVDFCDATTYSHKDIANQFEGKVPVSAGMIKVRDKKWYFSDFGSSSLKISYRKDDDKIIREFLKIYGFVEEENGRY